MALRKVGRNMKMNMEEMQVVKEFLENRTKVCRAQEGCDDCPFWGVCSHDISTVINDEARNEIEAAIEKMKSDGEPVVLHCLIY